MNAMVVRTMVTFRSGQFNTTERKPFYINDCCFGDDLAAWLIQELKTFGIVVDEKAGQEDFGWYITFRVGLYKYHFVVGYNADGYWLGWIERQRGLIQRLFGAKKRGIQPEAANAIHSILLSSRGVSDVRWHVQEDFNALRNDLAVLTPLG